MAVLAQPYRAIVSTAMAEQAELGQRLEVLAREEQLLVGFKGVVAQRGARNFDELALQLFLLVGQNPLRIPFETETPEVFFAPFLRLAHCCVSSRSEFCLPRYPAIVPPAERSWSFFDRQRSLHDGHFSRQEFATNFRQKLRQFQTSFSVPFKLAADFMMPALTRWS